jgi:osmotically-inducible protein OsmY
MNRFFGLKVFIPALVLGLACAVPAFAQDNTSTTTNTTSTNGTTGTTAGQKMHHAASKAGEAVKNAYQGAETAVSDTDITAKVKTALHENKVTHGADIYVHTSDGIVTLKGTAPSRSAVKTAKYLAQETTGVKEVRNEVKLQHTSNP